MTTDRDYGVPQCPYSQFLLTYMNVIHTEIATGREYILYRFALMGRTEGSGGNEDKNENENDKELVKGELLCTPAAAMTSLLNVLVMLVDNCGDGRVIAPVYPIDAEQYCWKRCSVCFHERLPVKQLELRVGLLQTAAPQPDTRFRR